MAAATTVTLQYLHQSPFSLSHPICLIRFAPSLLKKALRVFLALLKIRVQKFFGRSVISYLNFRCCFAANPPILHQTMKNLCLPTLKLDFAGLPKILLKTNFRVRRIEQKMLRFVLVDQLFFYVRDFFDVSCYDSLKSSCWVLKMKLEVSH